MLTTSVTPEGLKPVARGDHQIVEPRSSIEIHELTARDPLDRGERLDELIVEEALGVPVDKASDHDDLDMPS
jgi:hypothetical protein